MIEDNFNPERLSSNDVEVKYCTKCKSNIRAKNRQWCKDCFNLWQREYYNKRPKIEKKALNSKRNYGVNSEKLQLMIKSNSNKCEICKTKFKDISKINIDHCHKTNKVRGLLCSKCNYGIGNFNDNTDLLNNAIKYINHYKMFENKDKI